ncbi:ATP-binding protein [Anabaena sp. CA = ATCC 33047]|uniref:ATP-binding protein n=1 Tax=Anabaena sp. (strain CA / ATCC 33047) TaxID=52271 RepID=UPI000835DE9A|nr:ATP-binding protein [Anabaena sp. CA = ATCC 33047]
MRLSQNYISGITEADVLITAALASRPARQADLAVENQALHRLAQQLMDEPQSILKSLVEIAVELCQADSAGVSLLETVPNGESRFCWVAIAGSLEFLEQTIIPGNFSPCSSTIQSKQTQLYTYPERYFTYLHHPQFPIVEGLLIPLFVKEQPLGVLWICSHHEARRFDAEDHRLMNSLARFTASALQSMQHLRQTAMKAVSQEKAIREALQHSQTRFEALVANVPGMVYRYSPKVDANTPHRFSFVSSCSRELLELEPETILQDADSFVSLIHPEDLPSFETSVDYAVQHFLPWRWEGRIITPSGKSKWIQGNSRAVPTPEGDVWDGLFIDITNHKHAEAEREKLFARERNYANQLQGLTKASLAINSALSIQEVLQVITDQAASIIGTHQAVTSMTIDENWAQAINAVYLSDKYAHWRDYHEKPNGSGIYGCVCHSNRPMRMTQAELNAHPLWEDFGQETKHHPPLRGLLAAPLMGRDGHNIGLIQLSDKCKGEFNATDEAILVQLAQMASIAVENARLYEAQQQARSAAEALREQAQAANRVKDEFLAVLSHELRTPLNSILGWSNLLRRQKLNEAKIAQGLETIERNAKLQSELIEDLLDVSRILQGRLSLNVAPVDLATAIAAAVETVQVAAQAKSIKVQAEIQPYVGKVAGDSTRLQQVIWNLLSNAVKFTPEGGEVSIRLEQIKDANLEKLSASTRLPVSTSSYAQITVSDTGKGIDAEFLPYVFDYFRQADSTTTRKFGGLGLGLAIARHLVELHGGTIQAESPGIEQGATFTIRIPLMPTQSTINQDGKLLDPSLDLSGVKVLVVDDDTDTRLFIAILLENYGASVTSVSSASEALLVLPQSQPDVLLSDIGMPDMDGYMFIQQVRKLSSEQGGQIKAIALTAYAGEMNQQQALKAGFQKHISKPIEPNNLVQAISSLVRSS